MKEEGRGLEGGIAAPPPAVVIIIYYAPAGIYMVTEAYVATQTLKIDSTSPLG